MARPSLMSKMMKTMQKQDPNSTIASWDESDYFNIELIPTHVPMMNVALSGDMNGGIAPGLHMFVGDSKTFKTGFCLLQVKAYLDAKPDAFCVFCDCEGGASGLMTSFGIDTSRVLHVPFTTVEDLKVKLAKALDDCASGDEVIFVVDSLSMVASKKELEDALDDKHVADMTRAKAMNSLFRIVTPQLQMKKIPLFAINSYYDDVANKYADPIVKGGKQVFLSAQTIMFIGKSKLRDKDRNLLGFDFNIKHLKSRYCKEGVKIPITVKYDGGIDRYSGLLDLGRELGYIEMRGKGRYCLSEAIFGEGQKSYTKNEMAEGKNYDLFEPLLADENFQATVRKLFSLEGGDLTPEESRIMDNIVVDDESGEVLDTMKKSLKKAEANPND